MMFLLDRVALSELKKAHRHKANPGFAGWALNQNHENFYLSVIFVQEVTRGILLLEGYDPVQAGYYRAWLDETLRLFGSRILSIDVAVAQRCASLHVPRTRPERDALIAASALVHELPVVTRNVRDFEGTGVSVLNPWN